MALHPLSGIARAGSVRARVGPVPPICERHEAYAMTGFVSGGMSRLLKTMSHWNAGFR
jgi:hypothetical protein